MDEDGMITDDGWSTFIDELGYKGSGSDDDDEEDDTEEDDDDFDFMDDEDEFEEDSDSEEEGGDEELPKICSSYRRWVISVRKDQAHKYVITAKLQRKFRDEFNYLITEDLDCIGIYGDEIEEGADVESFVIEKLEEREEELATSKDWRKNYGKYMGLDEDHDYWES